MRELARAALLTTTMGLALSSLTGCVGDDGPAEASSQGPAPATAPSEGPLPGAAPTSRVRFQKPRATAHARASGPRPSPAGMRFGVQDRVDRVVFHLDGTGRPGWAVWYLDRSRRHDQVPALAGRATMVVRLTGVRDSVPGAATTWSGPKRLAPQTGSVVEEVRRGPQHGDTRVFYLGLDSKQRYRVYRLQHPTRVVVDVRRPRVRVGGPLSAVPPLKKIRFPSRVRPDDASPSGRAHVSPVDLHFGRHRTFVRMVLDLRGRGTPGWRAEYVDDPRLLRTKAPFHLAGDTTLRVRLSGLAESGAQPYRGPQRFRTRRSGAVREVVYGSRTVGLVDVYLGMDRPRPFRVFTVGHPKRLVVDVLR